jgi:hypothetical protein
VVDRYSQSSEMNVPKAWLDHCKQLSQGIQTSQFALANHILLNILSSRTLSFKSRVDILDLGATIKVTRDSSLFDAIKLVAKESNDQHIRAKRLNVFPRPIS